MIARLLTSATSSIAAVIGTIALIITMPGCGGSSSNSSGTPRVVNGAPAAGGTFETGYVPSKTSENTYTVSEVSIPARDGVNIKASEYVPDVDGKVPTVILFYPYGRDANLAGGTNAYLAKHGYAELVVDVRGTGASGGKWNLWSEDEKKDFVEVIKWAIQRPHSDGQVVLGGQSYAAVSALHAAIAAESAGVDAVKALFIRVPLGDAYRDVASSGGSADTGFLTWWGTGLIGAPSTLQPLLNESPDPITTINHLANVFTVTLPNFISLLTGTFDSSLPKIVTSGENASYDGEYFHSRSPIRMIDKIKVPTFIIGANYDIFSRTQPMLYNSLNLPNEKKKLIMVEHYHIFKSSWLSSDDGSSIVKDNNGNIIPSEFNLRLAWFDKWTKNKNNRIEAFPNVTQYFHGNPIAYQFKDGTPGLTPMKHYLSVEMLGGVAGNPINSSLMNEPSSKPGRADMIFQPLSGICSRMLIQYFAGELPDNKCSTDNRVNEIDGYSFTTEPAKTTTKYYGPSNLKLYVQSTRPDSQIVAFLSDVAEDGSSTLISVGHLVASHREVNKSPCRNGVALDCSVYINGQMVQPWHPFTLEAQRLLSPGEIYELDIEMTPSFLELKPGHKLRVTLKTGDFPHVTPSLSTTLNSVGGILSVMTGKDYPSSLTIGTLQ